MTFDLCTISTTLAAVAVIDHLYETLRSAACSIFVSIFTRHHTPGAGSARLLRLWRFNYRARCYCRKPLRAYQRLIARVKRNCINKHTKRENTHTKSIAAWVASPFYCFFFLHFCDFLALAWVSISYTIQYPRIHRRPRVSTPKTKRISQGNNRNFWTDSFSSINPKPSGPSGSNCWLPVRSTASHKRLPAHSDG